MRVKQLAAGLRSITNHVVPAKMRFLYDLAARWKEIVGPNMAAHTAPVSAKNGTLTIVADDPSWSSELSLMRDTVRETILEKFPSAGEHFERLKFFQGRLPVPEAPEKEMELTIDRAVLKKIDAALSDVKDQELKKALRGYFIRINLKEIEAEVKE